MNISISIHMKMFLPPDVYRRFKRFVPAWGEYSALVMILQDEAIAAAEKVFIKNGRSKESAREFYAAEILDDECTEAADLIISGAYRSYASVLNAFRLKALEDVAQSILDKFLES